MSPAFLLFAITILNEGEIYLLVTYSEEKKKKNTTMTTTNDSTEYKIVVFGASVVGKSAMTIQFVQEHFVADCDPTIEDSYRKQCVIDNEVAILDILDTAPHEDIPALREQYMDRGEGFLLVYSIIDRKSFNEIHKFHKQILTVKEEDNVPMVLVANKTDCTSDRVVSTQEGEELSKMLKVGYVEISAKHGTNVNKSFHDLVRSIRRYRNPELETQHTGKPRKSNCCSVL